MPDFYSFYKHLQRPNFSHPLHFNSKDITQCRTTRHSQKFCSNAPGLFQKEHPFSAASLPHSHTLCLYLLILLSLVLNILGISPHCLPSALIIGASLYLFTSPYLHLHRFRKPTYFLTHTWKGHSPGLLLSLFSPWLAYKV